MSLYCFTISWLPEFNPKAHYWLQSAHALGFHDITAFQCEDLYWIEGTLTIEAQNQLCEILHDAMVQQCQIEEVLPRLSTTTQWIERRLKPGVTDMVAEQIQTTINMLNITGIERIASGQRWRISASQALNTETIQKIVRRLGIDTVIHQVTLGSFQSLARTPVNPQEKETFELISIRELDETALITLSQARSLALNLTEMRAIQKYYCTQARDPSDIELETIAQTWSEHCSHKSFRGHIQYGSHSIKGLLKTYLRSATEHINAPWVASAFVDNAGIIEFDADWQLAFKVETHNHPSAIEPFGGANTGMGGVIRDVLGVSARPIAATDVFGFGFPTTKLSKLPSGSLHPSVIRAGVVSGVADYGNKVGIPTVNGAVVYDDGYTANPLVFCGCVGLLPKNSHPTHAKQGDRVIVLGGRTGRDGLKGATFSSQPMDAQTGEVMGAVVQMGNPIIAHGLIETITSARDQKLYHAITDCGAGGLSSAIGEMAHHNECGVEVNLDHVPLKYFGLQSWEIWLSESQERMVLAVPSDSVPELKRLCARYEVELTDVGVLTDSAKLCIQHQGVTVLQLDRDFLYGDADQGGMPLKEFTVPPWFPPARSDSRSGKRMKEPQDYEAMLLCLLSHPNIASKASIVRRYDHEVQGGTVMKPFMGFDQNVSSDACVIKPAGTQGFQGCVISNGINPEFGKLDPYRMAVSVIDEAVRNAVAVGADPDRLAILDNFCWGDLERPETLAALVECARGCFDAALHYKTPFISGKDSLNNEYQGPTCREAIPGTLLISALGIIDDVQKAVSMDFKEVGNTLYVIGETKAQFGGSHFVRCGGRIEYAHEVPDLPLEAPFVYRCLHNAMQQGWIRSCHDISEGGLGVALSEMCIGGRLGCTIDVGRFFKDKQNDVVALFSESNGRFVIEVPSAHEEKVALLFHTHELSHLLHRIGKVTSNPNLHIQSQSTVLIDVPIVQLLQAWQTESV